ncbi:hypothetical protein FC83_GL002211 [Agrilactobacillus composti DSM 18527 = JCM 14202]|uniref:Citrate lyase acyl carrier protein n=1 Tax=Agrilactobacillus composti DSM 18527 = JCM 14202 TaxID=1423734 RepID=X0PDU5_9LACO|nr:citrate lyase acyl carrier protein [Agrilactobacillus composti]KRM34220.1 hypothetical protein FC83_GL002211 [Agrilactobacillus composti DSM 18527 = JCM 14202]GAF39323.1 citrate lyase gamma chain, acyl carrier protein [Agrilactobacillus composti DSM 18527 = JCM 14202]
MDIDIKHQAIAGTTEPTDIQITIAPNDADDIEIELTSTTQLSKQIKIIILDTLEKVGITSALIQAKDQGAPDRTIKSRTLMAAYLAADINTAVDWRLIDDQN